MDMHGSNGVGGHDTTASGPDMTGGHGGHDMGGAGHDPTGCGHHANYGDHTLMKNYFHLSTQAIVLFIEWETTKWWEMLVSCLGVALLALIYEGLKVLREYIDARSRCHCEEQHSGSSEKVSGDSGESACCQDSNTATITPQHHHKQRVGILRPLHWLQTLLHFIQLWIGLTLMLVFMTFNFYLCLGVTVGGAVGYFFFGWIHRPGQRHRTEVCH